ncbi:UNKNOWN [Stylonychia lemnae]|uniref:EamA domain-containing protein n=1 Tax=Stylonychia lemnae TaxID=5949 RepID=A0A077ZXQ7_STYLE|nr:UNKNOWN [Stylonychia lemnae]|eukprot:CDW74701.1 UNKNOWN [Stylonychia lemnae]
MISSPESGSGSDNQKLDFDFEPTEITKKEIVPNEEVKKPRKYMYIIFALGAGLFYATQNLVLQVVYAFDENKNRGFRIEILLPVFVGYFITAFSIHMSLAYQTKQKYGSYWVKEASSYLRCSEQIRINLKNNGSSAGEKLGYSENIQSHHQSDLSMTKNTISINKSTIALVLLRSMVMLTAYFVHMAAFYTSQRAQINFSLIINIYALCPFLNSIMFYLLFKETVKKIHIIGMIIIFAAIVITSLSQDTSHHNNSNSDDVEPMSIMVPIGLAALNTNMFVASNVFARFMQVKQILSSKQNTADCCLIQATIIAIIFVFMVDDLSARTFFGVSGASLLSSSAIFLLNEALVHGKAGPASALVEIQSAFLLLQEVIFLGKIPNHLQLIGFFLGLAGGSFIAFQKPKSQNNAGAH